MTTEPTEPEPIVPPPPERACGTRCRHGRRRPGPLARLFGWLGPVYDSVYGRLNTEEWTRAFRMALTIFLATGGLNVVGRNPTLLTTLVVPFCLAVLGGFVEAFRRLAHGAADPPAGPPPPA